MKDERGFTIVELLIVIVVIAILAAITIVAYNGIQQRAHTTAQKTTAENLAKKVEGYNAINNAYPSLLDASSRNTTSQLALDASTSLAGSGITLGTASSTSPDGTAELRLCSNSATALSGATAATGYVIFIYDATKGTVDPVQAGGNATISTNASTANTVNFTGSATIAGCTKAS